jgi:hypothetical protein
LASSGDGNEEAEGGGAGAGGGAAGAHVQQAAMPCTLCSMYGGTVFEIDTDMECFFQPRTFPVCCTVCPQAPIIKLEIRGTVIFMYLKYILLFPDVYNLFPYILLFNFPIIKFTFLSYCFLMFIIYSLTFYYSNFQSLNSLFYCTFFM